MKTSRSRESTWQTRDGPQHYCKYTIKLETLDVAARMIYSISWDEHALPLLRHLHWMYEFRRGSSFVLPYLSTAFCLEQRLNINPSKSSYSVLDTMCANIITHDESAIPWVKSIKYLDLVMQSSFKCVFHRFKKSFYKSYNATFVQIG